jgi:uncharacterized protein (DUF2384 family)
MRPQSATNQASHVEASVVTKAAIRAADRLGLKNSALSKIVGLSEPTISRMRRGNYVLDADHKSFELALLFVRLYRSLDSIVAGDDSVAADWLNKNNIGLGGLPIDLIQTVSGLTNVIAYLDSRRAVI